MTHVGSPPGRDGDGDADVDVLDTDGPRRFLIAAAVAHYPKSPAWDLPDLVEARERIVRLFTGRFGYRYHAGVEMDPTKTQLLDALNAFCDSPLRREDDLLAVYLSCHGEVLEDGGEHVLFAADTDPDRQVYTGLPTAELVRAMLRGTRIRRVLLMLDACYAGAGGNQVAAAALEHLGASWGRSSGSGLVVVSSAQPHQQAASGLFPRLLEEAVTGLPVAGHGPPALAIDAIVQHIAHAPARPGFQRVSLTMVGLDGEVPAFFPNPRHRPQLTDLDLALQQAAMFDEQDRRRETELVTRLLVRAMGYPGDATAPAWWFTGRRAALHKLGAWLNTGRDSRAPVCQVVTGNPGSGKTAVLGLIATLAHPERRRTVPRDALELPEDLINGAEAVDAAVYVQRHTDTDVMLALTAAARSPASTVGELLEALDRQNRPRPLTVLLDALDEAATPESLCTTVLRPLIEHARGRIRLLIGTRAHLLPRLGLALGDASVLNLDANDYADPQALRTYTMRTLLDAYPTSPYRHDVAATGPVADAVTQAAGTSFLVSRITAGTLAAADTVVADPYDPIWRTGLPRQAGAAMREDLQRRLGDHAQRAVDLLRPLAYAQGQGLPWEDIWAPLASEIAARAYTDEDVLWLRRAAGSYVVEATESGRSAYRLYHQAMAEHLRDGVAAAEVHAAYTRVLTRQVPRRADGSRDYARAHPYTLAHLAFHAGQAGELDQILAESEYLVHADPRGLTPQLPHAHSDRARLSAAVYRTSLDLHHEAAPDRRRQILALDAARAGADDLQQQLNDRTAAGQWAPVWATGSTFTPNLRNTLSGHTDMVCAVACTVVDGVPLAVTGGFDTTVRLWDLRNGQPVGHPLVGHADSVSAVACTVVDGVPLAVTGGGETVRVWDLRTGQSVGEPLVGHTDSVVSVACTVFDGVPIAVTGSRDATVRMWNLRTGRPVGEPLIGDTDAVQTVACMLADGVPIAVTGNWNNTVLVWDLHTGLPVGDPLTGHTEIVEAVACMEVDGAPIAVTGSWDETVRVWDLRTGQMVGYPLTGHTDDVYAVACAVVDGVPLAVTGGRDATVRVWDLRTQTQTALLVLQSPRAVALTAAGDLLIGFHHDLALFRRR